MKQVTGSCFILYHLPDKEGKVLVVIKDYTSKLPYPSITLTKSAGVMT